MDEALAGHRHLHRGRTRYRRISERHRQRSRHSSRPASRNFRKESALEIIMWHAACGAANSTRKFTKPQDGLHGRRVVIGPSTRCRRGSKSKSRAARSFTHGVRALATRIGKLEDLGKINNRRGTKIRFKPDNDIFGAKGGIQAAAAVQDGALEGLLVRAASRFAGVCDPSLLKGVEDVPAEDSFHFPGGLKDYLASRNTTPTRWCIGYFFPANPGAPARMARANGRWAGPRTPTVFLSSYCNTISDAGRRHARIRHAAAHFCAA